MKSVSAMNAIDLLPVEEIKSELRNHMHIDREKLLKQNNEQAELTGQAETVAHMEAGSRVETDKVETDNNEAGVVEKEQKPRRKFNWKKNGKYILLAFVCVLILAASLYKIIINNAYTALNQGEEIDVSALNIETTDNMIVVRNPQKGETKRKIGIIFYQDNRVEADCYLPLMEKLANLGYDCFLSISFGNQSFLNVEGAETVIRKYTSIKTWVIAAHSAGCNPAAQYILEKSDKVQGLICLGGYTKKNLSGLDLAVLSILGSKDSIVDQKAFENAKKNLPEDAVYQTIKGGNNSAFADTKLQDHDTKADLSFDQQTDMTRDMIHEFLQAQFDE